MASLSFSRQTAKQFTPASTRVASTLFSRMPSLPFTWRSFQSNIYTAGQTTVDSQVSSLSTSVSMGCIRVTCLMAGHKIQTTRSMITVDMEAENAWNKVIAFKPSKDSVHKVRRPKTVLYDSTLEPIETCTTRAKNMLKTWRDFELWFQNEMLCFM